MDLHIKYICLFWIYTNSMLYCNCQKTTLTPIDPEVDEWSDVTFVCTVSDAVRYVNWWQREGPIIQYHDTTMAVQNGTCVVPPPSFLSDTNKYSYTCNSTVYQVTVKMVDSSQDNDVWSCFPGNQTSGPNSTIKVVYVDIKTFTINEQTGGSVTVNENETVIIRCEVNDVPDPIIRLTYGNYEMVKSDTTRTINHVIDKANCSDAGMYICSANRQHNDFVSVTGIRLYVKCLPRSAEIKNQSSVINASFTFTYNAIAYRIPSFTWWMLDSDKNQWNKLTHNGDVSIQSSDLQSKLTISKATMKYFTKYKLDITNDIGTTTQLYSLPPNDKPETPTELHIVEDRTTSTSIHLEWRPGFNGGSQQTFHIRIKKSPTKTWNYINITDTGEDMMSYTITCLTEKTQYNIVMYASNIHGQSAESYAFISLSKEHEVSSSMIGYYVGAALGCFILIVLPVILVWRFRSKQADRDTQAILSSNAPVQNVSPSEGVHYDEASNVPVQNISLSEDVYYSEASGPSYELLDKESRDASNYSSLDTSAQHQKEIAYENMKLKTFKCRV